MGMIDDKPRSATVRAIAETVVKEIHRDEFLDILQSDQDAAIKILKALFSRLREANIKVLQLQAEGSRRDSSEFGLIKKEPALTLQVTLHGLTPLAGQVLPENPYHINRLPFRIGRTSPDPLAHNDLTLADAKPFQISRHHVMLFRENERVGVIDRGSTLGAEVDGKRFGGANLNPGPVFFAENEGTLVLGTFDSPFRYRVTIDRLAS
jgi:pSer/pThr/pTyr-binding forkhead associated (FHA) protein